jgi:putative hemolysin
VLRLLGLRASTGHELVHSVEELQLLVHASQRAGVVEESEARIASRAFQFADLTAGDLMTPRTEVGSVPVTIGRDDLLDRVVRDTPHSRLLVHEGSLDNIVGAIRARDLLGLVRPPTSPFDLRALLRAVLTVPETRAADDLLEDMRRARRTLAVVIDEYGGTAGVVTLSDLVRALVGQVEEPPGPEVQGVGLPRSEPDGSVLLDGLMRLHELEELLGVDLAESERAELATLGGLVMARLDRMPRLHDEVVVADRRLRVEQLDGRRVAVLRLLPISARATAPPVDRGAACPIDPAAGSPGRVSRGVPTGLDP